MCPLSGCSLFLGLTRVVIPLDSSVTLDCVSFEAPLSTNSVGVSTCFVWMYVFDSFRCLVLEVELPGHVATPLDSFENCQAAFQSVCAVARVHMPAYQLTQPSETFT